MAGLSAPDASLPEKVFSFALPLAAGTAAALHPAGARGLAGLTSAVHNQLAVREFGQRERAEQDRTMRLSQLLDKDTGEQIPDVEGFRAGLQDVTGTPEGPVPMPTMTTRPQKVSDVLGRGPTELVRAMLAQPGSSREVATFLAGQMAPKPQWHLVDDWDPVTRQPIKTWKDLSKSPSGTVVGRGRPVTPLAEQVRQATQASQFGGAAPPPQPAAVQQDIPAPPAGPPPAPPPIESAPLAPPPTAQPQQGAPAQVQARPTMSWRFKEGEEPTLTMGQGTVTTHLQKGMRNGREWLFAIQTDQSGQQGQPVPVMEAPSGEGLQDIQRRVMGLLPKVPFGTPEFNDAVNAYSLIRGTPQQIALGEQLLVERFGVSPAGAQPGPAPQPGAQPGSPQQGAVSPVTSGAMPPAVAPRPRAPMGPLAQQAEAERIATQQKAAETAATTSARERAQYTEQYKNQELGAVRAAELQLPGGRDVDPTWTQAQAAKAGARKVKETPPKEIENFTDLATARSTLDEIERLVPSVDLSQIVGGIREWANQVAQTGKVGPIPIPEGVRPQLTEEQNRFLALTSDYADAIVRIRTGMAMPAAEYTRLLSFLLSPALESGAFTARLHLQQDRLRVVQEARERYLDSGGYKVPRGLLPSMAPPTAQPGAQAPPVLQRNGYSVGAPVR